MSLPVKPPVDPMLAKLARELPLGELLYEPKWDGFRCLVFRDGDDVHLQSRNKKPLERYFPEILDPLRDALPDRCVLDGELAVPIDGVLDFDALSERIHPAESRVAMLAEKTPSHYVAFDLLAIDGEDLMAAPFRERRDRLETALVGIRSPVHVTPATTDPEVAADWFQRFEGAGLDGVMAKPLDDRYRPGKRVLVKVKHERTADVVVAGFRMHKDGQGVGSLMLGLYDREGFLRHIGVASSFTADFREQLLEELQDHLLPEGADHPWFFEGHDETTTPRGGNRWNAAKDMSWTPLVPDLVIEVRYEQLQGDRLRHGARFKSWRPDRDAESCTYEQLEVPPAAELHDVFGTS
ncbi:MAG: ATP-dependent DNA ligase [Nitriliruptorales bacterium]|nr:ATP-dependent DNA ligase [Nitriliruptorales bacterium]